MDGVKVRWRLAAVSLLVTLVRLVDRLPELPLPPKRGRGRPRPYPDRLLVKAVVVMIVRHLHKVPELLPVLDHPTAEMGQVRALLALPNGRFPARRTWERRLAALPATLPAQIACLGHLLWLQNRLLLLRCALIGLVEATQYRHGAHWCCQVAHPTGRSLPVEVRDVLAEHPAEMIFAEDEHLIAALAAHTAEEALARRVRLRRVDGCAEHPNAAGGGHPIASWPVLGVVIPAQETRARLERGGLAQLLGDSGVGRVARHAHMRHAPGAERDHDDGVHLPEEQVSHGEEVAGPDLVGVVAHERGPALPPRPWRAVAAQISLDGALDQANTQLPEFAQDPLGAPQRVLGRQPADRRNRRRRERRAAWTRARPLSPERAEARAIPAQERLGPHEEQRLASGVDPPSKEHQYRAIRRRY
ncbi:MAG TPA: hypothetical protein VFU78_02845 [Thermomicrobiales bacterium]|nr:hypothetical protein [Thermomicrobiales bacterium]